MTSCFWTNRALGGGPPTFNYQVLPEGNYDGVSLAAAVINQMGSAYTVTYDASNLALKVSSATLEFKFVLPSENTGYPTLKDQSCSAVIGHTVSMSYTQTWASDRIPQLHRLTSVFLHSDIGEAQSFSPHGAQDVIRKITVTVPFGGLETDVHVSAWDWVDSGGRALLQMRCTFKYGRGAVLDTKGLPTLFSLVIHAPRFR